jgi:homoserine acetyltransferase
VRTPALIVAAAGDPLCPPDAAEPAAAALPEARFVILPEPYGHLDVLVGRSARDEVFPQILDFLEEHRGRVW